MPVRVPSWLKAGNAVPHIQSTVRYTWYQFLIAYDVLVPGERTLVKDCCLEALGALRILVLVLDCTYQPTAPLPGTTRLIGLPLLPYALLRKRWTSTASGPPTSAADPSDANRPPASRLWMINLGLDTIATIFLAVAGYVLFDFPGVPDLLTALRGKLGL